MSYVCGQFCAIRSFWKMVRGGNMQSFDQLWQIAKDQHARNLREAEQQRLAKIVEESNLSGPGLHRRLLWRIGDGLVATGARLTAGRPAACWQLGANQQGS